MTGDPVGGPDNLEGLPREADPTGWWGQVWEDKPTGTWFWACGRCDRQQRTTTREEAERNAREHISIVHPSVRPPQPAGTPGTLEYPQHGPIPVPGNHDHSPPLRVDTGHWVVAVPSTHEPTRYQWRCECGASGAWTTHQTLAEAQGREHQRTVYQEDTMPDDPSRPQFVRIGSDDEQRILAYSDDAAIRIGMQLRDALQQAIDVATIEDHLVSISLADWFQLVTAAARADGYLTMGRS